MTGEQIRIKYKELQQQIKEEITPELFTLNSKVLEIKKQINDLQLQCPHEWMNNKTCKYCGLSKQEEDNE